MKNAENQVNTRVSGNKVDEYGMDADAIIGKISKLIEAHR